MWSLNWIPFNLSELTVNLILTIGVTLCFLSFIVNNILLNWVPVIKQYILPVQLISIVLLLIGSYFKGIQHTEKEWQLRILQEQQKIVELERKTVEINNELAKKIAEKSKTIYIKGETIYKYIDREVVKDKEVIKFVESCPIPSKILELHNAAATNTPIDEKKP